MSKRVHPVWGILEHRFLPLMWLAHKTGYSYSHVKNVKYGIVRCTPEFRSRCAVALDLPESVLFLSSDRPSEGADDQTESNELVLEEV